MPLSAYPQFILWTIGERDGKKTKLPIDYRTGQVANAHDRNVWTDAQTALATAAAGNYGIDFVFTDDDPFFFLDIDKCWTDGERWSSVAYEVINKLPGAAVEISQSGRGLHVFGAYTSRPEYTSKNIGLGLKLYTSGRFVALTGTQAIGSARLIVPKLSPPLSGTTSRRRPPRPFKSGRINLSPSGPVSKMTTP